MKRLVSWQRFVLALLCILGLLASGGLAFFYASNLNGVQIGLLTLILSKLTSSLSSAYAWFFDGTADKPEPPVKISVPDDTQPAVLTAPPAPPGLSADSTTPQSIGDVTVQLPQEAYDRLKADGWTDEQLVAAGMSPPVAGTSTPKGTQ
jgi:hypothetical protein